MLDIALLGTGGSMPMPQRFLSSLLIKYKGRKILIDCGEGTQVSMRMLKWGFKSIDIILITHGHGDHILGLPGLLSTIGNSGRTEPITIIGPEGIGDLVKGLSVAVPYLPYDLSIIENPKENLMVSLSSKGLVVKDMQNESSNKDMIISTLELEHSSPCIGYGLYIPRRPKFDVEKAFLNQVPKELWKRLQNGEILIHDNKTYVPNMVLGSERKGLKISYITDTRPVDTIIDFIEGSHIFICEGTYGSDLDLEKAVKNKHMTFREAAILAHNGNVKELLLTHFSPSMDKPEIYIKNAIDIFPNTTLGYDRIIKTIIFED